MAGRSLLGMVAVYLVLGNVPRFISLPGFRHDLLVTEGLIYMAAGVYALSDSRAFRSVVAFWPVYLIVAASTLYGCLINGIEARPVLYAIRLVLLVAAAAAAGRALFARHHDDLAGVFRYLVRIYMTVAALSLALFIVFPDASDLWAALSNVSIHFEGDPHENRLVSTYFDPNYYAAIACLPLMLAAFAYRITDRSRYLFSALLLLVTIAATSSRSGSATVAAVLVIVGYDLIARLFRSPSVRWSALNLVPVLLLALLVASPLYIGGLVTTWQKFIWMGSDPSALARLSTFEFGLSILAERPVLGIGYHFLAVEMPPFSLVSSVDSSPLATLIDFGLLLTAALVVLVGWWFASTGRRLAAGETGPSRPAAKFHAQFVAYLAVVVVFSSQFNNLLYYQFWLFPVLMLAVYFRRVTDPPAPLRVTLAPIDGPTRLRAHSGPLVISPARGG